MKIKNVAYSAVAGIGVACLSIGGFYEQNSGDDSLTRFFSNANCWVDPTCRKMSDEEILLARQYFGDEIDYDVVHIYSRAHSRHIYDFDGDMEDVIMYVFDFFGNSIYQGPAYNDIPEIPFLMEGFLLHELGHIWHNQTGASRSFNANYLYDLQDHQQFFLFGYEEQAEIIRDIYNYRMALFEDADISTLSISNLEDYLTLSFGGTLSVAHMCATLNQLEHLAAQELPIEITDCSQFEEIETKAPEI